MVANLRIYWGISVTVNWNAIPESQRSGFLKTGMLKYTKFHTIYYSCKK